MELEPDLVVAKAVTGQARPVDRVLAFLDPLLGCRSRESVVDPNETFVPCNSNEPKREIEDVTRF
jgi:hypothetical protein